MRGGHIGGARIEQRISAALFGMHGAGAAEAVHPWDGLESQRHVTRTMSGGLSALGRKHRLVPQESWLALQATSMTLQEIIFFHGCRRTIFSPIPRLGLAKAATIRARPKTSEDWAPIES